MTVKKLIFVEHNYSLEYIFVTFRGKIEKNTKEK